MISNNGHSEYRVTRGRLGAMGGKPCDQPSLGNFCWGFFRCALALLFVGSCTAVAAAQTLPGVDEVKIRLKDPACIPDRCVCVGSFKPETWLQWHGPRPAELASGVPCIVADFDGNGANDYALPGAEGLATVVLMAKAGFKRVLLLDAGGVLEFYGPRKSVGPQGEPASRRPGLLVRNVGRNHAVFVWRDDWFVRILFPAQ